MMRTSTGTALASLRKGASVLALALPLLALSAPARAQDSPADENEETPDQPVITVTGSRLGAGFTAPTPVTAIGAAQIEDRALTSVAELSYEIPQLRINQNIGRSSEPVGQNQVDLRALGAARTLQLLDGRRVAATSPFGGTDSNIYPLALIKSVEVVTGGASAAWGSDAVAGVINFSIDKEFTGLKVDASYGVSKYGDYKRPVVSAAAGASLLDDRLHLVAAGDFYRNTGQTSQASRPWGQGTPILFSNPSYTPTNGQTKNYIAYDGRLLASFGGLVMGVNADTTAGNGVDVLRGIQFGPGGTVLPYNYGSAANANFQIGGDGVTVEDDGNLMPYITRYSGYGRAGFDVSDNLSVWADVLYSRVDVESDLAPNFDIANTALTIRSDNAYLPTTVRNLMTANSITSFRLHRLNLEDGYSQNNSKTRALRYAVGIEGSFGQGWEWDAYYQRGDNTFRQDSNNNRISANWTNGVDSVLVAGVPVCRINADVSTTNDNAACVPINVFGAGSISPQALAWYRGTSWYSTEITQELGGINLKGKPFSTWADEVSVAFGAEIRHDSVNSVSDAVSQTLLSNGTRGGWRSINQQPFSGALTVKEGYFEAAVPLAKGVPMAHDLELNGAIRYADYSSSGGATTWKVGLNYSPVPDIRFRGTISRDIRAANLYELYAGPNQVINSVLDSRPAPTPTPAGTSYNVRQLSGGNANLTPERADTKSFGVVLRPSIIPGLSMSLDYYKIKIDNAITTIPSANIVAGCYVNNVSALCDLITIDTTTNFISLIKSTYVNAQTIKTSGVDFEASYRKPVNWFGTEGTIGSRLLVNYVSDLSLTILGIKTDYVGDLATDYSGQPQWKANFDVTYQGGPIKLGAYVRHIGGGKFRSFYIDNLDLPLAQNRVKARTYIDLSASFKLTGNVEFYGKIDNLFDVAPPILPNAITQPTVANSQMYDKIGRYFVAGVRLRL